MAKNETTDELASVGSRAAEVAQETYEDVKEKAGELYEEGLEKTRELGEYFSERIRENPLQAVLISAGVGLLLGRFRVRPIESLILAAGTGLAFGVLWNKSGGLARGREGGQRGRK